MKSMKQETHDPDLCLNKITRLAILGRKTSQKAATRKKALLLIDTEKMEVGAGFRNNKILSLMDVKWKCQTKA